MSYYAEYNRVLKLARAEGVGGFAERAGDSEVHHQNAHDLALQDYLTDSDDPRAVIVHKNLQFSAERPAWGYLHELEKHMGFEYSQDRVTHHDGPDGRLTAEHYSNSDGRRAYRVHWSLPRPGGERTYQAVLSPDEFHRVLPHFGGPGAPPDQLPVTIH